MRIGFDAKWIFNGPPSGRLVVRHLVEALAADRQGHDITIFLDERDRGRALPFAHDLQIGYVWGRNSFLANQWSLPRAASAKQLSAVVYQNFVPFRADHGRVAFIYDAIFADAPQYFTMAERVYFSPMRPLSRRAERVCTISDAERVRLARLSFSTLDDIAVAKLGVPNGFGTSSETIETVPFELPPRYVLFVGRLNVRKNIGNLLRALALVNDDSIPLLVVGSPDWKSHDWQRQAREIGVESRVRFLGSVDDAHMPSLYQRATLLCFPSFDEGFGLPALEAMACGTPVVASRIPALVEVCDTAAEYVDPHSPRSIANGIDAVAQNQQRRKELSAAGPLRARKFSWRETARSVVDAAVQARSTFERRK